MKDWRCSVCHQPTSPSDLLEKRLELREVVGQARYRVALLGRVCRSCGDREVAAVRAGEGQGSLL